jgi:hypothetical protein
VYILKIYLEVMHGFVQIERWTCPFKIFRMVRVKELLPFISSLNTLLLNLIYICVSLK